MTTDVLDTFDIKILDALQLDGRLTNNDLSERVGLSPSQCSRRRQALEEAGLIASYHAQLDADRVGLAITVFVNVKLAAHSTDNARKFASLIGRLGAVQEAYSLTGASDYMLKLVVPDLKSLSRVLNDVLLAHPSVAHVQSSIVLDRLKQTTRLPLDHLGPQQARR
jgi:DNA-binding Lrp family transcriptional regulator